MQFVKILSILAKLLQENQIPYLIVGGVALGMHGYVRATKDIDFMVREKDKEKIAGIMKDLGYELFHQGNGFMQYEHQLKVYGLVDYLLARSAIGEEMIANAVLRDIDDGITKLQVARLEDIIILKLLVLKGGKERGIDRDDLEAIFTMFGASLDWDYLLNCAILLGMEEMINAYRKIH
jgi:hypothetical protein